MKIVLTHPLCWPYERRGVERYMSDFGRYLTARGHEVVTLSTRPGRGRTEVGEEGTRILLNRLWVPPLSKIRIQLHHIFLLTSFLSLRRINADVVQSYHYVDALAARLASRRTGFKTTYFLAGVPVPTHVPRMPPDRCLLRMAIQGVDEVWVTSRFTGQVVERFYSREARVFPLPVDLKAFPFRTCRPLEPVILSLADFRQRRKGVRLLLEAFQQVKAAVPSARLRLSGGMTPELRTELLASLPPRMRPDLEILGIGELRDLPALYGGASLTVLPSMWETFGLVMIESWACGTPVVASHHGGLPEAVTDPRVGITFDPRSDGQEARNAEGLATAILRGLELASREETAALCREQARLYSWDALGPSMEGRMEELVRAGRRPEAAC